VCSIPAMRGRRHRTRRRIDLGIRIGLIVREARERQSATRTEIAGRSGVSRQMITAVEAGTANPTLDLIGSLLESLDTDLEIVARSQVLLDPPRRHDDAHSICSAYVQRRLERSGWQVAREVRIEDGRYLGWIDLMAFHPLTETLLVIEIKTRIDDVGAIERTMAWHIRGCRRAAERLGWRPRRVHGWLLALCTEEVEDRLREQRGPWRTAFPLRAEAMQRMVSDPTAGSTPDSRGLALIDPRSRRRAWLIRSRVDGRRAMAPFRGYADFIRSVRRRR
jgi:transcriptional regulator with XRE-family HTH domain